MKNCIWAVLCGSLSVANVVAREWVVSPEGPGLEEVRNKIRMDKAKEAHSVLFKDGRYHLSSTFELASADSGTAEHPVVYKAINPGKVLLSTAPQIAPDVFRKPSEQELTYLKASAREHVLVADMTSEQAKTFGRGQGEYSLLAWNEHVMQLAQWPNRSFNMIGEVIDMGPTLRWLQTGEKPEAFSYEDPCGGKFTTRQKADFAAWNRELQRTRDIEQDGFISCDWTKDANMLGRISDDGVIQLLDSTRYGIGGIRYKGGFRDDAVKPRFKKNRRILFRNLLCELDMPGEWYFDRKERKLYLWPIDSDMANAIIAIPSGPLMVDIKNASHLSLEGLTFQNGGGAALTITGGNHVRIAGCTFRNMKGRAGFISGGANNGFVSCDFYNMENGVSVAGGDCSTLTRANHYIANCDFHDLRAMGYGAIGLNGCGIEFRNNRYHRISSGISYSGMYISFTNNEFYDVGWGMGDWNVLYQGADIFCNGNLVENNFFHHMFEQPTMHPIIGVRNDDGGSGTTYKRNVFYKTGSGAVTFAGPNSHVLSNIALDCASVWRTNKRAITPGEIEKEYQQIRTNFESGKYPRGAKEDRIYKVERIVGKQGWNNEPFRSAFPAFRKYMNENPFSQSYGSMLNNYGNFVDPGDPYGCIHIHGSFALADGDGGVKHAGKMEAALPETFQYNAPAPIDRKHDFVDYQSLNFELKPGFDPMPGFEPCDFDVIGLYADTYRPNPPSKSGYRSELYRHNRFRASVGGGLDYTDLTAGRYYPVQSWVREEAAPPTPFPYLSGIEEESAIVHVALRRDMGYTGHPIRLNGKTHAYGITACPPNTTKQSEMIFDLKPYPNITGMSAVVGIDDAVGKSGSCAFIIQARKNGKWEELFRSPVLRGSDDGRPVSVRFDGHDTLKLIATDGGNGIGADHAVWADAQFTR